MKKKNLLLISLIFILFIPLVQTTLHFPKDKKLDGFVTFATDTNFTFKGWFDGAYQKAKEKYLNDNFGFHNTLVRVYNQLDYTLYTKTKVSDVVFGKDGYLYQDGYIVSYNGDNFYLSQAVIDAKIEKLKLLQEKLKKMNKDIMILIAPSKAMFYPEYIPDKRIKPKKITNYEYFTKKFNQASINYIDYNKWFLEHKNKTQYPLYSKHGIHWSFYGLCLVTDSLIRYIEKLRNTTLNHAHWNKIEVTDEYRYSDNDVIKGMNLLFKYKGYPMAYPNMEFENNPKAEKPRTVVVGDSYYWVSFDLGMSDKVFGDGKFWYYDKEVFPDTWAKKTFIQDLNFKQEIDKTDLFLIITTETNLWDFPCRFIDRLWDEIGEPDKMKNCKDSYQKKILELIPIIKADPKWYGNVLEDAKKRKIGIDSMLYLAAKWVVDNNNK